MKRGVDRYISLFFTNRLSNKKHFQYDFDVVIDAHMTYEQVSNFFNFHFSNQTFPLDEVPEGLRESKTFSKCRNRSA